VSLVEPLRQILLAADPTFFRDDDGKQYLVFKEDSNSIGKPTHIYIAGECAYKRSRDSISVVDVLSD
jgi:beta-xylosidase